jgi:hypothetical protein
MARTVGMELHVNATEDRARVIYLGVPTLGTVSIRWHAHLMQLQNPMFRAVFHGYGVGFEVGQARNYLVEQAMQWTDAQGRTVSHVFFVDDDVLVPPYALSVLLDRKRPIVSGLYYAKTENVAPLLFHGHGLGVAQSVPRNTVVECFAHGMGCTLIELRVFRELLEAGLVQYETLPNGQTLPQFFKTTRDEFRLESNGQKLTPSLYQETEDVHFLKLARQLGYTAAVDTSVFCFHWDEKQRIGYPRHLWDEFQRTGQVTVGDEVAA